MGKKDILDYLFALQRIELYKEDSGDWQSPYQLEMCRIEMHRKLFDNQILPTLHLDVEGFTEDDAFIRSKELFGNLDKIWRIYDLTPFDIKEDNDVAWMAKYLDKFLNTTETKYFLEGRIQFIHGIHI